MTQTELAKHLKDRRYTLGSYPVDNMGERFGIMPLLLDTSRSGNGKPSIWKRLEGNAVDTKASTTVFKDWTKSRFYTDLAFGAFLLGLLGFTVSAVINVDNPNRVFAYRSREVTIGFRVAFAILGILVARYWTMMFQDAQNFSQYTRLHAKPSEAKDTINKKSYSIPLFAIVPLARMGYVIPASIALTALLSEFFVVALAGLPYRPGQLRGEFLFCGIAAMAILVVMLMQLCFVFWWRRKLPHMPRRPDSVASIMSYIAETSMTRDFEGMGGRKKKERDRAIEGLGKRYAYGLRVEEDGRKRWVVDEVGHSYESERQRMHDERAERPWV
jgi:hypothetical protein